MVAAHVLGWTRLRGRGGVKRETREVRGGRGVLGWTRLREGRGLEGSVNGATSERYENAGGWDMVHFGEYVKGGLVAKYVRNENVSIVMTEDAQQIGKK